MLVLTQITTVILLSATYQAPSPQTCFSQLRVTSPPVSHESVSVSSTATLRLVIGFLDKLLTDMTSSHWLIESTEMLASSLIQNYAALGVPAGLDPAEVQEGIRCCEDGLSLLASAPDLDISPLIAAQLESTLISIQGDLSDE